MKILITTLLLFSSSCLFAFEDQMFLKGGISYSTASIVAQQGTEDDMKGLGFNTHFGYKWTDYELSLSSYTYWGNIEGLTFAANGEQISGNGSFRHVSFGPVFKYHYSNWQPYKSWTFFTGFGPVWSLQTVKMEEFTSTGSSYNSNQKLTFESFGGLLVFGIEEQLKHKEAHPAFIEVIYSYKKSHKLAVVDASDFTETNILSKQEGEQELSGHFLMISVGITIF